MSGLMATACPVHFQWRTTAWTKGQSIFTNVIYLHTTKHKERTNRSHLNQTIIQMKSISTAFFNRLPNAVAAVSWPAAVLALMTWVDFPGTVAVVPTGNWTWLSGSNQTNQKATFGILGIGAPENGPGSRYRHSMASDSANRAVYVFGGSNQESGKSLSRETAS